MRAQIAYAQNMHAHMYSTVHTGFRPELAPMTDPRTLLKAHRESIDRLDAILVYTLGERFKHTREVGKLKAAHNLPPSDPLREAEQIERLEKLAVEADLDPEIAREFLTFIISKVIRHHEAHRENS
jgi:chorismate mutase